MVKDYGQYHNDIYDLLEFTQGTADIREKYLVDAEIDIVLKSAIDCMYKAHLLLIKKSELNVIPASQQSSNQANNS